MTYAFRCSGDKLADEMLGKFDASVRHAFERTLGGSLRDTSWWQATIAASEGGLGLREAMDVSLPAFLASRITSRPLALEMAQHAVDTELLSLNVFAESYDARTRAGFNRLCRSLPASVHEELRLIAEEGAAAAAERWGSLKEGLPANGLQPSGQQRAGGLVMDAGSEDPELPGQSGGRTGPPLQAQLSVVVDRCVLEGLKQEMEASGQTADLNRLKEIADPDCNHMWLWALNPQHGPVLQDDEFVEAVRLRLGAGGPSDAVPCALCGVTLDAAGAHASCCAIAEATRGHNHVKHELHSLARKADSTAEEEPLGLIPHRPMLRPADVFTSAAHPGRLSALDVGIGSAEAEGAGSDCAEAMRLRKLSDYGEFLESMERQNIVYCPVTWSSYGRPHASTTSVIRAPSRLAARRRGWASAREVQARAEASIAVEIWRRAAKMSLACWPRHGASEEEA